jgi:hypothetical protein
VAEAGQNGAVTWNRMGYKWKGSSPFQRVTTIKSKKGTGSALTDWAARMVAEEAQRLCQSYQDGGMSLEQLVVALMSDRLKSAHNEKRDAAADFGSVFHGMVEEYALGLHDAAEVAERNLVRTVTEAAYQRANPKQKTTDAAVRLWLQGLDDRQRSSLQEELETAKARLWPDVQAFLEWEAKTDIRWIRSEFQVFNRALNYAGSVDAHVEIGGAPLILDVKTSRGVYYDYAIQLAAYRYAEFVGEPDGTESPVPAVEGGVILHVHGGECRLLEIPCGPDQFAAFKACKALYDFDRAAPKELPEYQPRVRLDQPVCDALASQLAEVFA